MPVQPVGAVGIRRRAVRNAEPSMCINYITVVSSPVHRNFSHNENRWVECRDEPVTVRILFFSAVGSVTEQK